MATTTLSNKVSFDFWTSAKWQQGFTGKLDVTNLGKKLDGWTIEFEAPFEITNIWDAEIISKEGNRYTIGSLNHNNNLSKGETETITFNANKVNGKIIAPKRYAFNGFDFWTSAKWQQGFTGKLDVTNFGQSHDGWTVEFEAPFKITNIWDAKIISHKGNKYVLGNLDYNKNLSKGEVETITFNATKVNGKIVAPKNFSLDGGISTPVVKQPTTTTAKTATPTPDVAEPTAKVATDTAISKPGKGQFNYGEALQKSFLFFEANRSGKLPTDNRIEWRGDSALKDGADVGRNLTGGYYDAGDHVKFGLPMSANNTMLAWGGIEYKKAYQQSGQWDELLDAVKWGTDYFLKAHVTEGGKTKEFYAQVGDGNADHAFWGAPEKMTMKRPAFKVDRNNPGSDVAGGTASALASASMLFRGVNNAYADKLLRNAKQLFEFADTYRGKYSDSIPQASPFYTSFNGYADELAESAAWLYKATGQQQYLDRAEKIYDNNIGNPGDWTWAADDKGYSALLLLAQESDDPKYKQKFENWASNWTDGKGSVKYSPGGLAWRTPWASLALSSASAFMVELYNDTVKSTSKYEDFSIGQVDYILGDNPRNSSYMVGFGKNYPKQPHHRAAAGNSPHGQANEHILFGALVGGPSSTNDFDYNDDRGDWITNEVATGYNAPLTSALIQAYDDFGGNPLSNSELDNLIGIDVDGI